MADFMFIGLAVFAQGGGGAPAQGQGGGGMFQFFLTFILPIFLIFYFLFILPQKREQRRRRDMLAALKKNDRVLTVGGMYGVVTNVHLEADEITLKVDESTNTKIRVTLGSIARVLGEEKPSEAPKETLHR